MKVVGSAVNDMLDLLVDKCYLYKLGLSNTRLNEQSMAKLCELIRINPHLVDIDISWNELFPASTPSALLTAQTTRSCSRRSR